jgi:hypothetical protein
MLAAIISDKSLFSIAVPRIAVGNARRAISSRAAKPHQQQVRTWSQNLRGKSCGLKNGCSGEPMSATMRTVCTAKKIDMHTNRETRRRIGINLEMTASAAMARQKTRDRSINNIDVVEFNQHRGICPRCSQTYLHAAIAIKSRQRLERIINASTRCRLVNDTQQRRHYLQLPYGEFAIGRR